MSENKPKIDKIDGSSSSFTRYLAMREQALNATAEQLNVINMPDDRVCVYGAVVDMELMGRYMSLVCYLNGEISMLYSTGRCLENIGEIPSVLEESNLLISSVHQVIDQFQATKIQELPKRGKNHFYLLTNKGLMFTEFNPTTIAAQPRTRQFPFMLYQRVFSAISQAMPQILGAKNITNNRSDSQKP